MDPGAAVRRLRGGGNDRASPAVRGGFPFGVNIIDELEVPPVPAGEYVLGLRYDAETESTAGLDGVRRHRRREATHPMLLW